MSTVPQISVVTPSFNQGSYIGKTIESVLNQNYENLEYFIIDGASTDNTKKILARYRDNPRVTIVSEPDNGQSNAINKGFKLATGEIFGFLNSDDTLKPGALARVADEIDVNNDKHIVMGRCEFVDENDKFIGIEHPSYFYGHRRVLKIWKGHGLPQPSTFWTRQVWEECGPMDENEKLVLDYDLFCRFSKKYNFHFVDQVFSTYRLHSDSITSTMSDQERLTNAVKVSKKYWGSSWLPSFWLLEASWLKYRFNRKGRSANNINIAIDRWRRGHKKNAIFKLVPSALSAPDVAWDVLILPLLRTRKQRVRNKLGSRLRKNTVSPETTAFLQFNGVYEDGWVGPCLLKKLNSKLHDNQLTIEGEAPFLSQTKRLILSIFVDDKLIVKKTVESFKFAFAITVGQTLPPGEHVVKVVSNIHMVPHELSNNNDMRPLSFKLTQLSFLQNSN